MSPKKASWLRSISIYGLILAVIFCLALLIRILPRVDAVFGWGWVRFGEVDPWYHVRLLENLLQHFPHQITIDPYSYFPYGQTVAFAPFFDLILGAFLWIIGMGSPSVHTIETAAAYFPAVLGALTVIPVYFIGKALFNKKAGIIAAAVIAILPGNFLARSLLGVVDHHVAETLFSTVAALFLILAIKNGREKITFSSLRARDWSKIRKSLIYGLLGGLFLGMYVNTWIGSLLFLLIIVVYFIIQFVIDHLMGKSTAYLCLTGIPAFLVALILLLPFLGKAGMTAMYPLSLGFGAAAFAMLGGLSWLMEHKGLKRIYFLWASGGAILAAIGIVYAAAPGLFHSMVGHFDIFLPQGNDLTISEVQPVFSGFVSLTQNKAWGFFTTGLFTVPAAFILLTYSTIKNFKAEHLFLLCWTILMLAAMMGQNRFSYYFAVNVAVLNSYLCWRIFGWISRLLKTQEPLETRAVYDEYGTNPETRNPKSEILKPKTNTNTKNTDNVGAKISPKVTAGKKARAAKRPQDTMSPGHSKKIYAAYGLSAVIAFFLVIYPNISPAIDVAKVDTGPNQDWHAALLWMRDHTPEPFQDPGFFNGLYKDIPSGKAYPYPESAYGVMSSWDYGHWITQIARRIPNANPHQSGADESASFFLAQDETQANEILNKLGSRYVIIDIDMATTMFINQTNWVNEEPSRYVETYFQANARGQFEPVTLYYPEYYRSLSSRLYNFKGESVVPNNTTRVITYENRTDTSGTKYKRITLTKVFASYDEANAFCQKTPNSRIVGTDLFSSPVPLEKLEHYRLVHESDTTVNEVNGLKNSYVEIFEYQP